MFNQLGPIFAGNNVKYFKTSIEFKKNKQKSTSLEKCLKL